MASENKIKIKVDLPSDAFPDSNEIKFGKHLAANEKKIRDRAVEALKLWLQKRNGLTDTDFLKIWKCLFYCMWMCDKIPVQMELAHRLAELMHVFQEDDLALSWFRMFARTLWREWQGLDHLRLDKYYAFVRKVVFQAVEWVRRKQWSQDGIKQVVCVLNAEILQKVPNGLRFHVADLYLSELARAGAGEIDTLALKAFLQPFYEALCTTNDKSYFKRTKERVFEDLLNFMPQENDDDEMETEGETPEENDFSTFKNVNFEAIQSWIFEAAGSETTAEKYRKQLYELHELYQSKTNIEFARSLKQLVDEKVIICTSSKDTAKGKKKQRKSSESGDTDEGLPSSTKKKKKIKKQKEEELKERDETSNGSNTESKNSKTPGSKKKAKKKKKQINLPEESMTQDDAAGKQPAGSKEAEESTTKPKKTKNQKVTSQLNDKEVVEESMMNALSKNSTPSSKEPNKIDKIPDNLDDAGIDTKDNATAHGDVKSTSKKKKKKKNKKDNEQNRGSTPEKVLKANTLGLQTTPKTPNVENPNFISSKKFKGAKDGYVFKKDHQGIGYYLDKAPKKAQSTKKGKKKRKNKNNSPGNLSDFGSEKKVRFGGVQERGFKASVKALKKSAVTPNKSPPSQGLLKTPDTSSAKKKKSIKGRKGTPFVRKTSRSFL